MMTMLSRLVSRWLTLLRKWGALEREHWRAIAHLFETNTEARLLDLGCSDGRFTMMIAEKIGTSHVFGVDIVPENVERSKARGFKCYQADLNRGGFPFKSNSFDAVCASQILEHVYDTDGFAKEVYRVLKPGGYTIISTPNLAAWHCIIFLLLGWQPAATDISDEFTTAGELLPAWASAFEKNPGFANHRRVFTLHSLKAFLSYHGFEIERSIGTGLFPFPASLARLVCAIDKRHAHFISVKARKPSPRDHR